MSRQTLTPAEAEAMLPDGERIHTFVCPSAGMLVGADWNRKDVIAALSSGKPELAGAMATGMDHGIALLDGGRWVFIATKPAAEPVKSA